MQQRPWVRWCLIGKRRQLLPATLQASLVSVFLIDLVPTAFLVFMMGVTNRRAPVGLSRPSAAL
jgi:hypothetical protein